MIQTAFKVQGEIGFPDRSELTINAGTFREVTSAERSFENCEDASGVWTSDWEVTAR